MPPRVNRYWIIILFDAKFDVLDISLRSYDQHET